MSTIPVEAGGGTVLLVDRTMLSPLFTEGSNMLPCGYLSYLYLLKTLLPLEAATRSGVVILLTILMFIVYV